MIQVFRLLIIRVLHIVPPVVLAFSVVAGALVVRTFPGRHAALYPVWGSLTAASATASGAVFLYATIAWKKLKNLTHVHLKETAPRVLGALIVVLVLITFQRLVFGTAATSEPAASRATLLIILLFAGAVPVAFVMYGISVSLKPPQGVSDAVMVERLIDLRRLLLHVLRAVGSLVALTVFTLGAWVKMDKELPASLRLGETAPAVFTIGATGALLVALLYVPATVALRDSGLQISRRLFPLGDNEEARMDPKEILETADKRARLGHLLSVDRGILADLEAALVILGPLIAGAAAAFIGAHNLNQEGTTCRLHLLPALRGCPVMAAGRRQPVAACLGVASRQLRLAHARHLDAAGVGLQAGVQAGRCGEPAGSDSRGDRQSASC